MKKEFDLLALGEVLLRLSPVNDDRLVRGDTFEKRVGGAELNVLTGASLLGLRTGIISRLPDNDIGKFAKNAIRFSGVSDDYLTYDSSKDARLGIYFYESGLYPRKPRVVYDRNHSSFQKVSVGDFSDSLYESARCFHTSGITLALCKESRETAIEMIKRFKAAGAMISFDVNFRGNLWSGDEARECIKTILPYVDIFFCSEDTARLTFLKEGTAEEIMKSFTKEYPISVVASTQRVVHSPRHHDFGSVIYSKATDTYYKEESYKRIQVIDRIGSGDSYVGGVLYALLSEPDNFQRAVEFGNAYSAVKNTVRGDMPLSGCDEIEAVIKEHKNTGYHSEMAR